MDVCLAATSSHGCSQVSCLQLHFFVIEELVLQGFVDSDTFPWVFDQKLLYEVDADRRHISLETLMAEIRLFELYLVESFFAVV